MAREDFSDILFGKTGCKNCWTSKHPDVILLTEDKQEGPSPTVKPEPGPGSSDRRDHEPKTELTLGPGHLHYRGTKAKALQPPHVSPRVGLPHPKGVKQREGLRPDLQDPILGDSQEMSRLLEPLG